MSRYESPEIVRLEAPTRERFEREYLLRRRPVILTGVANRWPAFGKWTPEYLKSVAGDVEVTTRYDDQGDHQRYYTPEGQVTRKMTFGEFLDCMTADPPDRRFYLTEYAIADVSKRLLEDVDWRGYMDSCHAVFFIGQRSFSPPHYHGDHEAMLCQVQGTKTVKMYPPEQTRCFYPYAWHTHLLNFARVDDRSPDLERFPRFRDACGTTVVLEPGEILFIPIHWWHSVSAHDLNISVTFFWPASRRRYHFPQPALQMMAHHLFAPASIVARGRKLARKVKRVLRPGAGSGA